MKVLLLKHNITDEATLSAGLIMVKNLCANIGLPISFDERVTTTQFTSVPFVGANAEVASGWQINPQQILDEEKKFGDYVIDCLVFDASKIKPTPPTNPTDNAEIIQIPTNWFGSYPEVFAQFFLHELCHEMFWRFGKPDITHNFYTSPFAQLPDGLTKYYQFLLKDFVPLIVPIFPIPPVSNTNKQYKYFSDAEVMKWKLSNALWLKLDEARGYAQTPFKLTSGYRSPNQNTLVGGSNNSSHLTGNGCDIACTDSVVRWKVMNGLLKAGFTRIGIYPTHIHADIGSIVNGYSQNIMWFNNDD